MRRNSIFYIVIACCLLGAGCGDFLEEYSRDQVYAASWEDLDEVLIGNGYMESRDGKAPGCNEQYYGYLFTLDDDAEENLLVGHLGTEDVITGNSPIAFWRNTATWQKNPYMTSFAIREFEDKTVDKLYAHIAYVNTIINYLDQFPDDPIEERMRIRGEGQFLRAAYYLMASNLYGWAYDVKNSGADPSVPLKTFEWVVEDKFTRATVGEVYDLIETDLKGACENLRGIRQPNFYRTNQLAAHILLSRVYLYMEKYDEVIARCDSALNIGVKLLDLNAFNASGDMEERDYLYTKDNPEIVFTMGYASVHESLYPQVDNTFGSFSYSASQGLMDEYRDDESVKDLRLACYFMRHQTATGRFGLVKNYHKNVLDIYPVIFESFLIRSVEVYLNKAEAQAMKGDLAGAASTLQPLLDTRYAPGMQPQLAAFGEEELVNFIRSERRRELCFEGHRWFDLKRYAVNTKHPYKTKIRHEVYNAGNNSGGTYAGYFILGYYGEDEGWIMPFGDDYISYNEGLLQNPERPERLNEDPNFRRE